MKRINYLALAAAGLLMASCSQEDLVGPAQNGEGNYHVTVSLPSELGTRAMNDGLTANNLIYTVYDATNGNQIVDEGTAIFGTDDKGALSTTVNFNLPNGNEYLISFFAQSADSQKAKIYNYDSEEGTITVDYNAMQNTEFQADDFDCFVNLLETGVIGSSTVQTSVILYRPMAQINWGTNDLHAVNPETGAATTNPAPLVAKYFGTPQPANVNYPLPYMQSTLTTKAYDTFSILENDVPAGAQPVDVTIADLTQPLQANGQIVGFPVTGYRYVAMQYILVPKTETLADLNLNINNGNVPASGEGATLSTNYDVTVASAPVQANFRTNIYGTLLTDNVQVTVTKSQYWAGTNEIPLDEYDKGAQVDNVEGLYYNPDLQVYTIETPGALEYVATNVTLKGGITVVLAEDLDMKDVDHTPFNLNGAMFNGGGHTVSNLTVNITDGNASAGFFASAQGYVQNLNITGANITGQYKVGGIAGDGLCAHIDKCSVTNSTITSNPWKKNGTLYDDANNVGGIVGYLSAEGAASTTNCTVSGCTITAYRKVGGAVGYAGGYNNGNQLFITNNQVTNTTVIANQYIADGQYDGVKPFSAGEIVGELAVTGANFSGNVPQNVTVKTINSENEETVNVSSQEALQAAVGTANAVINLQPGNYDVPNGPMNGVTFTGTKDVVFNIIDMNNNLPKGGYNNVTFSGVSIKAPTSGDYYGVQGSNITFENCNIDGMMFGYGDNVTYKNCNWTSTNWCMWTYTAKNLVFDGCTFNCEIGKGFNVYNEAPGSTYNVTYKDCKFIAKTADNGTAGAKDGKAAVMVKVTNPNNTSTFNVDFENCTVSGFSTNTNTGDELWSYQTGAKYKVTVDGKVYTSEN